MLKKNLFALLAVSMLWSLSAFSMEDDVLRGVHSSHHKKHRNFVRGTICVDPASIHLDPATGLIDQPLTLTIRSGLGFSVDATATVVYSPSPADSTGILRNFGTINACSFAQMAHVIFDVRFNKQLKCTPSILLTIENSAETLTTGNALLLTEVLATQKVSPAGFTIDTFVTFVGNSQLNIGILLQGLLSSLCWHFDATTSE